MMAPRVARIAVKMAICWLRPGPWCASCSRCCSWCAGTSYSSAMSFSLVLQPGPRAGAVPQSAAGVAAGVKARNDLSAQVVVGEQQREDAHQVDDGIAEGAHRQARTRLPLQQHGVVQEHRAEQQRAGE